MCLFLLSVISVSSLAVMIKHEKEPELTLQVLIVLYEGMRLCVSVKTLGAFS